MKISCLPVSFFAAFKQGEMTIAEWLDFAAELGLDGVECGPLLVKPLGPVKPSEFRAMAEERGLAISNFTGYSDFVHPDPDVRRRELESTLAALEIALELGAPSVRALTGQQWPGVEMEEGIARVIEGVQQVADEAERLGIQLNLENHTKAAVWTHFDFAIKGEIFLRIMDGLRDSPVGVQFDTANPLVVDEDPLPLFDRLRSRVKYLHVNDLKRAGAFEFVAVGAGIAPVREVVRRLYADGYQGWLGIEEASRTGRPGFQQAVQYLREVIREL